MNSIRLGTGLLLWEKINVKMELTREEGPHKRVWDHRCGREAEEIRPVIEEIQKSKTMEEKAMRLYVSCCLHVIVVRLSQTL